MSEDTSRGASVSSTVRRTRFHQAVSINEDVKRVVRISNEVNLAALNAMLIAKRSGRSAAGFGVVSVELRAFSQQLDKVMADVGQTVESLVMSGATLCRQRQRLAILERAGSDLLSATLADKAMAVERIDADISQSNQQLAVGLNKALRLCAMGGAISRSAKIESVHCQEFSVDLKQVSDQVERAIAGMMTIVKSLQGQLTDDKWMEGVVR